MSEVILKIENLSKQYRLGTVGTGTLSHDLNRWWHAIRGKEDPYLQVGASNDRSKQADSQYVWALQDINLEVRRGEVLGIIGKNGAGKSTLLKILSRVTLPSTGVVKSRGRIASLLEVGTGFHPELTGRENIYLNGAILGMTKAEIKAKEEEIIEFSGCAMYIDTPVKRYSSGMRVRLGFAVAAFLEPDILVVDEVLAVGDAEFQKKAIGKMQDISQGDGRTVLFVSHNMRSVQQLCNKVSILEQGRLTFLGDTHDAVSKYLRGQEQDLSSFKNLGFKHADIDVSRIELVSVTGVNETRFSYQDFISVMITYKVKKALSGLAFVIRLIDSQGNVIFTSWDSDSLLNRNDNLGIDAQLTCEIPDKTLKKGQYFITFALHIPNRTVYFKYEKVLSFRIDDLNYNINEHREGVISPVLKWKKM